MSDTTASWPTAGRAIDSSAEEALDLFRIRTLVVITLLFAVIRIGSIASAPWDWDEALFSLAVAGDFDITLHRPHPPGFPLYIGAARLIAPLTGAFPALQTIVVLSAIALFPLMFFVATELGFGYRTSVVAASLLASFPNVVVFSGSAFSDVPSLALTLGAVLLLLKGRRSPGAFVAGAAIAALSAGIRVQGVLACLAPALLALPRRRFREVVRAATLAILLVTAIYGAAVVATGSIEKFESAVRHHGDFIARVDSFRSPSRPPLGEVFELVLRPWEAGEMAGLVLFFAVIALVDMLVNRHAPSTIALATFGPFLVFAWLMLDPNSMSRLSIGYMPLHALLAARGITVAAGMLSGWLSLRRGALAVVLGGALSISMLAWVREPVAATRADEPPPVAAMTWVRHNLAANDVTIRVESATLGPFADLELPGWDVRRFDRWSDIRADPASTRRDWILVEGRHDDAVVTFSRTERHLRQVVRDRYFDVSVIPLDETIIFGDGWYGQEGSKGSWWRWMAGESSIVVPGSTRERRLHLVLEYPTDTLDQTTLYVELDGEPLEVPARPADGATDIVIPIPPLGRERTITMRVGKTVRPVDVGFSGDTRVLGARLVLCELG